MPRTEPCGYRRITAALRPRGRGRVDREAVRTRPCAPRARQAARPRRKARRHRLRPPGPGARAPTWSSGTPAADRPGRAGGWATSTCIRTRGGTRSAWRPLPAAAPRKQSGTRLGRQHAAPSPLCEAIDMAARRCPTRRGKTIFHSDRGSQYTSEQFARHLKGYDIRPSVGRTGVCWDNAWAESFNATLKNERVHANGVPHETQGHQRYCLVDRADIQSDASSLGARVPDAGRGRTRFGKQ